MRAFPVLALLLLSGPAAADVYKSVDADGNIVYSDKPSPNAEKIELGELPTIPALATEPPGAGSEPEEGNESPGAPVAYKSVVIADPPNDAPLRMEADSLSVPVTVNVDPPLSGTDTLVLFVDGKEYASGRGPGFTVSNLERGTHELRAIVRGADGTSRAASSTSTFHILLHSALEPKSTVGQPPKK